MVKIIFTYETVYRGISGSPKQGTADFKGHHLPPSSWIPMVKAALDPNSSDHLRIYGARYYDPLLIADDTFEVTLSFPDISLQRSPAESFCVRCQKEGHGTTDCPYH